MWYYVLNGQQQGPLSQDALAQKLRSELTPDTLIWKEGMADWVKANELPEFQNLPSATTPPPFSPDTDVTNNPYAAPQTPVGLTQDPSALTREPAHFGLRLGAMIIDGIILNIAGMILGYSSPMDTSSGDVYEIQQSVATSYLISTIIAWLYSAILESSKIQGTLGKKLLGIKVTDMEGERISFGRASGRHFAKILSSIILLIGYFMMLWDKNSQTLHDKISGCLVSKR